jgi:hypothetical protein
LSVCSQTCLGLTCKTLYETLKKQHPNKISLYKEVECLGAMYSKSYSHIVLQMHPDKERLGHLLQKWGALSSYRLCTNYPDPKRPWLFLSKEVYGEAKNSEAEQRMRNRWQDYLYSPSIGRKGTGHPTKNIHELVPKPFGISGEDWTAHMIAVIKNDIACWDSWNDMWEYWGKTWVFAENWRRIEEL